MESRRELLRKMIAAAGMLALRRDAWSDALPMRNYAENPTCTLYRAVNGKPAANLAKVIEMMGGIEKLIGSADVVVIKPNVQWWNQGAPNLAALKHFVDLIMERLGGFRGKAVVAENCHRDASPWQHADWIRAFEWNFKTNKELCWFKRPSCLPDSR